jgi:hypothetical protein
VRVAESLWRHSHLAPTPHRNLFPRSRPDSRTRTLPLFNNVNTIPIMSKTVQSILDLIRSLRPDDRAELVAEVEHLNGHGTRTSLRDIRPVSAGRILRPLSPDDDLLEEMGA